MPLLLKNIKQIVNVIKTNESKLIVEESDNIHITNSISTSRLSIIINDEGIIEDIIDSSRFSPSVKNIIEIDCNGGVVMPGFVDAHTHPVWAGDRVHEFTMKMSGASYIEIHEKGGGIHFTVRHTKEASEGELYASLKSRLKNFCRKGTTTLECKSGYGLTWEDEKKLLKVLTRAKRELPLDISITYLAAHAVPKNTNAEEFTEKIINEQIPLLEASMKKGEIDVDNIDVFCEKGVYNINQTKRILEAGMEIGLAGNFHADELTCLGGAEAII
ncbi:unnamed protein product [Protopolystoma xenopodis]|uniref:imidazolonepropionase n=1 Tax=Protopolystoma xenopodis TaxID=117903 RepID=A0A3S5CGV7_9PLAT|nr:unnamed protein product [Protopolystoma xenopodis]